MKTAIARLSTMLDGSASSLTKMCLFCPYKCSNASRLFQDLCQRRIEKAGGQQPGFRSSSLTESLEQAKMPLKDLLW